MGLGRNRKRVSRAIRRGQAVAAAFVALLVGSGCHPSGQLLSRRHHPAVSAVTEVTAKAARAAEQALAASETAATPLEPPEQDVWSVPARYRSAEIRTRVRFFPEKLLALTFDDGPDPQVTPLVLQALAGHEARATFFVNGARARRYPDLLRAIAGGGHAIGNHTYSHPARCSEAQAAAELARTNQAVLAATGKEPVLFRPPFGSRTSAVYHRGLRDGYTAVFWTISSADTRPIGHDVIARNVIHTPNPGDIALFHDGPGHRATAKALPRILEELGKSGFRFVTIPELLRAWDTWEREGVSAAAKTAAPRRGTAGERAPKSKPRV